MQNNKPIILATVVNFIVFFALQISCIAAVNYLDASDWFTIIFMFLNIGITNWITCKITGIDFIKVVFK